MFRSQTQENQLVPDQQLLGVINSTEPALAGQVSSGAWRDCNLEGTKERSVICRTATGLPILDTNCNQEELRDKKNEGVEDCEEVDALPCDGCTERCATIDEETGQLIGGTRIATLTGETCGAPDEQCNTFPCSPVRLRAGPWGECSCQTNTQTRNVDCVDGRGEVVDVSQCDAQLTSIDGLPDERNCTAIGCPDSDGPDPSRRLLQDTKPSLCDGVTCSGHGTCSEGGACECEEGFQGPDCQVDAREESSCPGGVLNDDGECCLSGVIDLEDGACCEGSRARLDKDGRCCDGNVDFCGVCGGNGVVDIQGKCCETLASSGLCCDSGDVDQCGVCNGRGDTCITRLAMEIDSKADPEEFTTCFEEWIQEVIFPVDSKPQLNTTQQGSTTQGVVLHMSGLSGTSQSLERELNAQIEALQLRPAQRNPCNILEISQVSRLPECNNSFCEIQETPGLGGPTECAADCPFVYSVCPTHSDAPDAVFTDARAMCAGHGSCYPAGPDPTCLCHRGFQGDLCDQCSPEQVNVNGFCVKRQKPLLQSKPMPPPPTNEALDTEKVDDGGGGSDDDGLANWVIVVIVVLALVVVFVVGSLLGVVWVKKHRAPITADDDDQPNGHIEAPPRMLEPRQLPDGGLQSVHQGNPGDPPSNRTFYAEPVQKPISRQSSWKEIKN